LSLSLFAGQKGVYSKILVVYESIDAIFNLREHCKLGVKLREIFLLLPRNVYVKSNATHIPISLTSELEMPRQLNKICEFSHNWCRPQPPRGGDRDHLIG
jgi:hypothetical protein